MAQGAHRLRQRGGIRKPTPLGIPQKCSCTAKLLMRFCVRCGQGLGCSSLEQGTTPSSGREQTLGDKRLSWRTILCGLSAPATTPLAYTYRTRHDKPMPCSSWTMSLHFEKCTTSYPQGLAKVLGM